MVAEAIEEIVRIVDPETGEVRTGMAVVARFDPDGTFTLFDSWGERVDLLPRGSRWPLEGPSVIVAVHETGLPARIDDFTDVPGLIAEMARKTGGMSSVAVPITVDGQLWGALNVSGPDTLPPNTEARLGEFAALIAASIANADAREAADRLSSEQGALRRVATLVARDVPEPELFSAVAEEVGRLLAADATSLVRYDAERETGTVAAWWAPPGAARPPVGQTWPAQGGLVTRIARTRRSMRIDDWGPVEGPIAALLRETLGIRASLGAAIVVNERVWGTLLAHSTSQPLPPEAELRLMSFAELVATTIAGAEARAAARRLADRQSALRRVATLVATVPSPEEVFAVVVEEVGGVLGFDVTRLMRFEEKGTAIHLIGWPADALLPSTVLALDGDSATRRALRTGRPARIEDYTRTEGDFAKAARATGVHASAAAPVIVAGEVWGVLLGAFTRPEPLPDDAEERLEEFSALVATAISNVEARAEIAASRARFVEATDEARRTFERDLHDGAQQRLVSLALELRLAEADAPPPLAARLNAVGEGLADVLTELREISQGLHPAILSEGGLRPALRAMARRSALPVKLACEVEERFEEAVEVTAYYVVSEVLTNAAKHAGATAAEVSLEIRDGQLHVMIGDDGAGGADPVLGSGLRGLSDRVEALGGRMTVASPQGAGTSVHVALPLTRFPLR